MRTSPKGSRGRNVYLTNSLWERLRKRSAQEERSQNWLIARALRAYLDRWDAEARKAAGK